MARYGTHPSSPGLRLRYATPSVYVAGPVHFSMPYARATPANDRHDESAQLGLEGDHVLFEVGDDLVPRATEPSDGLVNRQHLGLVGRRVNRRLRKGALSACSMGSPLRIFSARSSMICLIAVSTR